MENEVKKMDAKAFWERFQERIRKNNKELKENWEEDEKFTKSMMKILGDIFETKTQKEYYRVDLISYSLNEDHKSKYKGIELYSWNLEVAVEHENKPGDWMDEVVKLAHISCDLRVVIGYLPKKQKNNHVEYLEKINSELWENIAAWRHTKDSGDFLIIIGDSSVSSKDDCCQYTPYLYEGKKDEKGSFKEMN